MEQKVLHFAFFVLAVSIQVTRVYAYACDSCVENAHCNDDDECECDDGFLGEGDFYCYPNTSHFNHSLPSKYFCRIKNDPGVRFFDGQKVIGHFVGSTLIAQYQTIRIADDGGKANVTLTGWTQRVKGKKYYTGLELKLDQTLSNFSTNSESIRVCANVSETGVHSWQIKMKSGSDAEFSIYANVTSDMDNSSITLHTFGCNIDFQQGLGNFMIVKVYCASLEFGIRAYSPAYPASAPGVYVAIDTHCTLFYNNWVKPPICLRPGLSYGYFADQLGMSNETNAVTIMGIANGACLVEYPEAPPLLGDLQMEIMNCNGGNLDQLMDKAGWALTYPPVVNCTSAADPYQGNYVQFLLDLFRWFCQDKSYYCQSTKNVLTSSCAAEIKKNSAVQTYFASPCYHHIPFSYG